MPRVKTPLLLLALPLLWQTIPRPLAPRPPTLWPLTTITVRPLVASHKDGGSPCKEEASDPIVMPSHAFLFQACKVMPRVRTPLLLLALPLLWQTIPRPLAPGPPTLWPLTTITVRPLVASHKDGGFPCREEASDPIVMPSHAFLLQACKVMPRVRTPLLPSSVLIQPLLSTLMTLLGRCSSPLRRDTSGFMTSRAG